MRLLISFLSYLFRSSAQQFGFAVINPDAGAWNEILSSVGLLAKPISQVSIVVARAGYPRRASMAAAGGGGRFPDLRG